MLRTIIAGMLSLLWAATALAADRAKAAVDCKPAAQKFTYDCTIKLTNARTAAALEKAEVTVGADMPSMPMAHNVKPVTAKATGKPGEYAARLQLEMFGDWAVRLKIEGALRDQLVQMRNFSDKGSGPPVRKAGTHGGGHKHGH
jgi:hypothetical protein